VYIYVVHYDDKDPKLILLSDGPCFYLSTCMNSSGVKSFLILIRKELLYELWLVCGVL